MAIVYPYTVRCSCGGSITANLADGVNIGRTPEIRERILAGTLHRVSCPVCTRTFTAEKSFLYSDFDRGTFIQVKPRHDRHLFREASAGLATAVANIPDSLAPSDRRKLRVVFGMAELREKLVAENLNIDDRAVELLKVMLINDHPFLLHKPRLRIVLAGATNDTLDFVATYDFRDEQFHLSLPREASHQFADDQETLRAWTGDARQQEPLFELQNDLWVNFWRWSPQPSALDQLRTYAAELRAGRAIDTGSGAFNQMLRGLPRGTHLPGWAKQDLQLLFDEARRTGDEALQDTLFEIRFAKTLEDDWSANDVADDIDTLWKLLRTLPENDVAGNVRIRDLNLDVGAGGGLYYPQSGDIHIGSRALSDREQFEDVVRHEVGHGVHEKKRVEIDRWLEREFGWRMFSPTEAGIDDWITLMGGWRALNVPNGQRRDVRSYLTSALGGGSSWSPGPAPNAPAGHSWWQRDFGPRLAYERTGANWYNQYASWYRRNGRAFFFNYWYRTLCVVNESALALIAQMPSPYAAMSPLEFFAELYALYYDLDDPLRQALPPNVMRWFGQNVPAPPGAPSAPAEKEEWEDIARP